MPRAAVVSMLPLLKSSKIKNRKYSGAPCCGCFHAATAHRYDYSLHRWRQQLDSVQYWVAKCMWHSVPKCAKSISTSFEETTIRSGLNRSRRGWSGTGAGHWQCPVLRLFSCCHCSQVWLLCAHWKAVNFKEYRILLQSASRNRCIKRISSKITSKSIKN